MKKDKSPQPEYHSQFDVGDIVRKKEGKGKSDRYKVTDVNAAQNKIQIRNIDKSPVESKRNAYAIWHQMHDYRRATPPREDQAAGGSRHAQPAAYGYRMVIPAHAYVGWHGYVPVW